MGIIWLLISLPITALFCLSIKSSHALPPWALWIYGWVPGVLGLLWSYVNKTNILWFPKGKLYLWMPLLSGFAIGALSFFIDGWLSSTPLGSIAGMHDALLYFFSFYGIPFLVFFVLFSGGEICWRGYLWEKWKKNPVKSGAGIWLLWSLWLSPQAIAFSKNIFPMLFLNLALMPLLHFFRKKSQSILSGTLFYASLCASFLYFQVLFSAEQDYRPASIVQGSVLLILALAFFLVKKRLSKYNG